MPRETCLSAATKELDRKEDKSIACKMDVVQRIIMINVRKPFDPME